MIFHEFWLKFWCNFGNIFGTPSFSENRAPAYTGTSIRRVKEVRKTLKNHDFFVYYFRTRIFRNFYRFLANFWVNFGSPGHHFGTLFSHYGFTIEKNAQKCSQQG